MALRGNKLDREKPLIPPKQAMYDAYRCAYNFAKSCYSSK